MSFDDDLRRIAEKTNQRLDQIVRQAVVLAAQGVVMGSPVGNPQLWKVNATAMQLRKKDDRETYNLFVDEYNATRGEGERKMPRLGEKRLKDGFKVKHSDYVGGRFRANWRVGVGAPDTETNEQKDRTGDVTKRRLAAGAMQARLGDVIWVTNGLPYARRLEYGWSTQAPHGFVRITLLDLPRQLEQYVKSLK